MYSLVVLHGAIYCDVRVWCVVHFYADGSLIEVCAGFAVGVGGFGHKIPSPAGVFPAGGLFTVLRHIAEVKRSPERCLIPEFDQGYLCCLGKLRIRLTL
jgi:hypothetical protein